MKRGIDVSEHQKNIDWGKVKPQIDFAILREGCRERVDTEFFKNVKGCTANKIPILAVYHFIYAVNNQMAIKEAESCLANIEKAGLTKNVFVFADFEYDSVKKAKLEHGVDLGKAECELFTKTFCEFFKKRGYTVGVYMNLDYAKNMYSKETREKYPLWLADYTGEADYPCRLHQYTSAGRLDGIAGKVDCNYLIEDELTDGSKEEKKLTKLQEFKTLGDFYANEDGSHKTPYLEKKNASYLDDFEKNAGYNNYTKFARDVNGFGQPGCQGQPWCAEFQFWKLCKVLGVSEALKIMGGGFYNCVSITNHAKSKGTWSKTPKVGALVIFRKGSHVGSVRAVDGSRIYTNEGNTSSAAGVVANGGSARNKSYSITDPAIDGYVIIDWSKYDASPKKPWKASGTAVSSVNDLFIREEPSGSGYILGQLQKGNRFEIDGQTSGSWTHIKDVSSGNIGWVATQYIMIDGAPSKPAPAEITGKQDKTQVVGKAKVTASTLAVRTWAGTDFPQIKKVPNLPNGSVVEVMNYAQKDKNGAMWEYVRIDGKYYGFVSGKYLRKV